MEKFEFEEVENKEILKYYKDSKPSNLKGKKLLVRISKDNIKKIEKILQIDSSYAYGDASKLIKDLHLGKIEYKKENIKAICDAINIENSTRLSTSENKDKENGTNGIAEAIYGKYKTYEKFMEALFFNKTEGNEVGKNEYILLEQVYEKEAGNRYTISFATKFCHYMSLYCKSENFNNRDRYPIFDNIISKAIPLYLDYFKGKKYIEFQNWEEEFKEIIGVRKKNNEKYIDLRKNEGTKDFNIRQNYKDYCRLLELLKRKKEISYTGLDHLLWYCYKGRIINGKEEETNGERKD